MIIVRRFAPSLPSFITATHPLLPCLRLRCVRVLPLERVRARTSGASKRLFITGALPLYVFMAPTGRTVHGCGGGSAIMPMEMRERTGSSRIKSHQSALLYGGAVTPFATRVKCMFTCSSWWKLSHTTLNIQFRWATTTVATIFEDQKYFNYFQYSEYCRLGECAVPLKIIKQV